MKIQESITGRLSKSNDDFNTTTASMLKLSFDSKGYGVLDLVCLTSLTSEALDLIRKIFKLVKCYCLQGNHREDLLLPQHPLRPQQPHHRRVLI